MKLLSRKSVTFISIILSVPFLTAGGKVRMRIVQDAASYGYFGNNVAATSQIQLVARVKPANFSGPVLLKQLIGTCYNMTTDRYQYIFCPFQNITQYETVPRWNAYQGVLGVWGHWKIENNTFVSMILTHGDPCGDTDRSVEVLLQCGRKNAITNVTEPKNCHYVAVFTTQLLCHKDSFLVYPRLDPELQKQWDHLWTDYQMGYISEKGYNVSLMKMLDEAGLTKYVPEGYEKNSLEKPKQLDDEPHTESSNVFSELGTCNTEYQKLKKEMARLSEEIDSLKLMLDLTNVESRLNKGTT